MNKNTNAHFAELPSVDIQRSVMDRSHSHKFSGNVGDLIPIYWDEVLPGDTISIETSKVIRFQTMLSPMMDNITAEVHAWFVPNRLIYDHFVNFMGQNDSSAWTQQVEYTIPQLKVLPSDAENPNNNRVGTILDYLGFPVENQTGEVEVSALPVRAYCKIVEDWWRDENLTDPINIYTGDATVTATKEDSYIDDIPHGGLPFKAAKYHDYFTSCLPSPQKGEPVSIDIPVDGFLPVVSRSENAVKLGDPAYPTIFGGVSEVGDDRVWTYISNPVGSQANPELYFANYNTNAQFQAQPGNPIVPSNLWASMNGISASFTVNDLRYAFQLQKLLERDARGGTRYIEVIKSHFGITSPDARLQRSEYLGGNRFGIVVDQVANTAQSEQDFLGDLGAFSVTSDVHEDVHFSATEHGILMLTMVIRYDHTYSQGLQKKWTRNDRFSYFWPVFSSIGEQPVLKKELFLTGESTDDDVFGYNEAWAEYRFSPNMVSGEMRPYVSNGLYSWTLADDYESVPSLSDEWIRETEKNVDRVLAVTSENAHQFWCDFYFKEKWTRPMPVYSVPGLIDHF